MIRTLFLVLFLLATGVSFAEDPPGKATPVVAKSQVVIVKLANTPGKPASRSPLLPDPLDQTEGNAALHWLRAALDERNAKKKWTDTEYKWRSSSETPLADLPVKEVRAFLESYRVMMTSMEQAARCNHCDWGMPPLTIQTIPTMRFADIQSMRNVANVLSLQCRLAIKEGKSVEALHYIEMGLTLARHVGEGDSLIQSLIGLAIASVSLQCLEEWMQQPGSPNFYWALTQLPTPLVDCRRSMRQEMNVFARSFPQLRKLTRSPISVEQVNQITDQMIAGLRAVTGDQPIDHYWSGRLGMATLAIKLYPEAKKALLDKGVTIEQIQAMPNLQVVLLYLQEQYEDLKEDILKWLALPPWQGRAGFEKASRRNFTILREKNPLLALLLPAFEKVYEAQLRIDWTVAGLRTAEALRLYASTHQGQPPTKLSDITEVPLPINPYTGRDFGDSYQVKDGVGVLEIVPRPAAPALSRRFELAPAKP